MKQGKFISLISDSLTMEEKTIRLIVRNLRESGLFTTGSRGTNAPDITSLDAARVIIAVLASPSPSKAVEDVRFFGSLQPDIRQDYTDFTSELGLNKDKTLEETLVDYIENKIVYDFVASATIVLSNSGQASISSQTLFGDEEFGHYEYTQRYNHREQFQALENTQNKTALRKAISENEAINRIGQCPLVRTGKLPLEILHSIGFELIGWDVE